MYGAFQKRGTKEEICCKSTEKETKKFDDQGKEKVQEVYETQERPQCECKGKGTTKYEFKGKGATTKFKGKGTAKCEIKSNRKTKKEDAEEKTNV